jgi:transcriptional regulator NrdR family protein
MFYPKVANVKSYHRKKEEMKRESFNKKKLISTMKYQTMDTPVSLSRITPNNFSFSSKLKLRQMTVNEHSLFSVLKKEKPVSKPSKKLYKIAYIPLVSAPTASPKHTSKLQSDNLFYI